MADKKRQRPDEGEGGDNGPNPSKRGKTEGDESLRKEMDEGLKEYIKNVLNLGHQYTTLVGGFEPTTPVSLRFPILPISHNGVGISQLFNANPTYPHTPQQVQADALLGLAGLTYSAFNSYHISQDRFEEYKYRFDEFHRAYMLDSQAAAWIYYFNRAFKAHQDIYRTHPVNRRIFEYPCPPHYMNSPDQWISRVEEVLQKHGSFSDAFPGYGYQKWPATTFPSNEGIHVRYYGSIEEYTAEETRREPTKLIPPLKNLTTQPRIFHRVKQAETKKGILVWSSV